MPPPPRPPPALPVRAWLLRPAWAWAEQGSLVAQALVRVQGLARVRVLVLVSLLVHHAHPTVGASRPWAARR